MALNGTHETQVTGRVVCTNPKGFKLEGSEEWFNFSKYAVGIVAPEKHATVTVTMDKAGFVRSVESAAGTSTVVPTQNGSHKPASAQERDRTITRLAVLKAAAEFGAARPSLKSGDVLTIAASWERWVLREDSADETVDAF